MDMYAVNRVREDITDAFGVLGEIGNGRRMVAS